MSRLLLNQRYFESFNLRTLILGLIFVNLFYARSLASIPAFAKENPTKKAFHLRAMEAVSNQNYKIALSLAIDSTRLTGVHSPSDQLVIAMVHLSHYDENSQKSSLRLARETLEKIVTKLDSVAALDENQQFIQGMSLFQLGYIDQLQGNQVSSAFKTRSAAKILARLETNVDAQALKAIYDYYMSAITSKIPFMVDSREKSLKILAHAIKKSQYFSNLYRTSLVWMRYDQKKYQLGLNLAQEFLKSHPNNRIYLSIQADFYKKMNRNTEAYELYQAVYQSYIENQSKMSVRQLSAIGNLMLLSKELGKKDKHALFKQKFHANIEVFRSNMPASLLEDMENHDLIE